MRLLIVLIVLFSLLFLFGGLLAIGVVSGNHTKISTRYTMSNASEPISETYSMKQIDSLSSKYNYTFTSDNAVGSANLPN